ncbi:MAG: A1S_2505 family phage non-structural protein, partial [Pauljensenia sp.]
MTDPQTRFTPDEVTELPEDTVFVFGSNKGGIHAGGAARFAHQHFGAQWGVGDGPTGRCYAVDTMSGWPAMKDAVTRFLGYATEHPELTFWVTKLGT